MSIDLKVLLIILLEIIELFGQSSKTIDSLNIEKEIRISEDNRVIDLNCQLNEDNTFVWLKDNEPMIFEPSFMRLSLKEQTNSDNESMSLTARLTIEAQSGLKDQGLYECNGNKVKVINEFKNENISTKTVKEEVIRKESKRSSFFRVVANNFENLYKVSIETIKRFIEFYSSLGLFFQIIFAILIILMVLIAILMKIISMTYWRSALNYAKMQYILQQKYGINTEDKETTDEDEYKIDHYLDDNVVDYAFVSLLNDI